ncbi:MAG TPA: hypothetical protein VE775_03610 [Pyrinomonadaceae bacterium]|nr:hypothetical protein [Pyrinomonadaceae bacterium]
MSGTVPGERSKKQRRSRIVVNVDDVQPAATTSKRKPPGRRRPARPRSRNPRLLVPVGIIAAVFIASLLGGYFWWQSYKAKPAYSLALLLDAARRDDQTAFDALVDVDAVSRSLVPQVAAQVRAPGTTPIPLAVRRQIEANAQVLLPGARDQIRAALMQHVKDVLVRSGTADDYFLTLALAVPRVVEIKPGLDGQERDVAATASLNVNGRPVELGLRANDEASNRSSDARWRVVSVKSDELAARVAETLARVYPAGK